MSYQTYYLRAPTPADVLADVKNALEAAGIDPYAKALGRDAEGNDVFDPSRVSVDPAGSWYSADPTWDETKGEFTGGQLGDHCLVTARIEDPKLKSVIESFATTDPKKDPSTVADSEKATNGTSRIDPPATPICPIATK